MLSKLKSREAAGGTAFVAIALLGLWISRGYTIGTAMMMSTGYVPRLLCWLLLVIGTAIILRSLVRGGLPLERFHWRPIIAVTLSILAFALTVEHLGLFTAACLVVLIGSLGSRDVGLKSTVVSAVVLSAGCIAVFVWLLGQPLPVLPPR